MTGRIFEAGHTTAPDHMPKRAQDSACIQGGVHTRPDYTLDHAILLRAMRRDELLLQAVASDQGSIAAAGEE